jgi:A/G-specific adenine glycosylase
VPQTRFAGSDRQGRGRLIEALRQGPVAPGDLASVVGWEDAPERLDRVVAALVAEGMVVRTATGALRLP